MKTYKKNLIPIWIVLFVMYLFILFIYQMSLIEMPTIIFTAIYTFTSTLISLFVIGLKSGDKKLINAIASIALVIVFILSIGVASYIDYNQPDDFKKKIILLTGASNTFQLLHLKSEDIVSVEVGEYNKGEPYTWRYKVKVVTTTSETPYYFECSNYKCETMVRYTGSVED